MAGKWGIATRSMTPIWDHWELASAAHHFLHTTEDYVGSGVLYGVYVGCNATVATFPYIQIYITTDGSGDSFYPGGNAMYNECGSGLINALYKNNSNVIMELEFKESLKTQFKHYDSAARNYGVLTNYGIFSHETQREIISAGNSLPDRSQIYETDVMLVHYTGEYGLSNRVIFPKEDFIDLDADAQGVLSGQLKRKVFNTTLNEDLFTIEDLNESKETSIFINFQEYIVTIESGILYNAGLPDQEV